ncbi:ubiquitin-associated protein [Trifolium repens]|nr:ubiquitin-associated protein [Trifolium repens]
MCRVCASETDSCNFSSSVRRSTNCFSISSFSSGLLPPQSVDQHNSCHSFSHSYVCSYKRNIFSNKFMHDKHILFLEYRHYDLDRNHII